MHKGDTVVCIDNTCYPLTMGKEYVVIDYHIYLDNSSEVYILTNRYGVVAFLAERFLTVLEYRRNKILKLKERICSKKVIKCYS